MIPPAANPRYSPREELAHSVTHGFGVVLSVIGLAVLVALAARRGTVAHVVGCTVFGTSLVLLYTASTLYHSMTAPRAKRVLRVLDHAAIYLLIAGTYTPFALVTLEGAVGWTLIAVLWTLAVLGIVSKATAIHRFQAVSIALYLGMGWSALLVIEPLLAGIRAQGLLLVVLGGLAYTGGLAFYGLRRIPYHHMLWHLCVLAGSVLHYLAVLLYVIPAGA
jgi:hemolysin III